MAEISINVDDHGEEERLRKIAVFLSDLRSFWPLLVPVATSWWRRQFDSEGRFAGTPWAPLSPAYAVRKERLFPGRGILVATGDMRRAASAPIRAQTPTTLTLTIDDPKVQYHQDGTETMPARPIVFGDPLPGLAAAELQDVADEYINDLLRRV